MKILQAHNYYQFAGGEDNVLNLEKQLLSDNGHQVFQFLKNNREISNWRKKVKLLFNTHYSIESKKKFANTLKQINPDIVHVHNFFPLITPSIYEACQESVIPVVQTLHNYRLIHPGATLYHNERIDERSVKGSAYRCVMDGVYRNSRIQTAVVAHMIEYHRKHNTWNSKINKFISLTEFARQKFIEGGICKEKLIVKPNFCYDLNQKYQRRGNEIQFIFIGRIVEVKGIRELLDIWMNEQIPYKLMIFGEGPLKKKLEEQSKSNKHIVWMGQQDQSVVFQELKNSTALIFPSKWYEGFPMTIVEAFSLGVPVITSNIGSQAEIVKDSYHGLHFDLKHFDAIKKHIYHLANNKQDQFGLGQNARKTYLEKYTPEKNYQQLIKIYEEAIATKNN